MNTWSRALACAWALIGGVAACGDGSTGGEGGGGASGSGGSGGGDEAPIAECPPGAGSDASADAEVIVGSACLGQLECAFTAACTTCTASCVDGVFEEANCTDVGDNC